MKRMPRSRHVPRYSASASPRFRNLPISRARLVRRAALLAGSVAICGAIFPSGPASAAPAAKTSNPSLKAVLAEANKLSEQIDQLSEQYDALRIQLGQARAAAAIAREDAARDQAVLGQEQGFIGAIAVENYMTDGINPALQLLAGASPQRLLNRASIMTQLQQENGAKLSMVAAAEAAAQRARGAAAQEQQRARQLAAAMTAKVAVIRKKEDFFNGEAFKKAEAIFQQTGKYPITPSEIPGDSPGIQALKYALTRIGDPYVWGAAGPSAFDCSGLVLWAYAQIGVTLQHYTGDQWNEIVHVPRSELEPGDLLFFYADIGHVGLYVGNGLMVDAPTFGQDVQVQPVPWAVYVGGGYVPA